MRRYAPVKIVAVDGDNHGAVTLREGGSLHNERDVLARQTDVDHSARSAAPSLIQRTPYQA